MCHNNDISLVVWIRGRPQASIAAIFGQSVGYVKELSIQVKNSVFKPFSTIIFSVDKKLTYFT